MKKILSKKQFSIYFTLFISFLLITGCSKDFLEQKPQGVLTEVEFLQTQQDAILATNAIYASIREWNFYSGGYPILDIMSDDAVKGSNPGDGGALNLFNNFQFTATSGDISRWYSALYKAIRRTNIVIEKVPLITMDEALKTRLIAEAKFFRALAYFDLVRAFGDVPKITVATPPNKIARSPKTEIYNEIIIADLKAAIDILPEKSAYKSADMGRATKGAAKALLAKAYLYLGDFVNTEKYALEIIGSTEYDLEPDYSNAFSVLGQHGMESILEIGALAKEDITIGGNQYANTQGVRGVPNRGWGFNRPSVDLINSYEAGDIRKDSTIIFLGDILDGVVIEGDPATPDITYTDASQTVIKEIETYNQKVWVPGTTTATQWGFNTRIIRYADILLMAAEALNENGDITQALYYLNLVRNRAGLADYNSIAKDDIRAAIWKERRSEFAMEGQRYFDLVRTGQAAQVLGVYGFVSGKHELFPIPQSEIDLAEGTLTQNLNW